MAMQWMDRIPWPQLEADAEILPRAFYVRPAAEVARALLGKILVHRRSAGMIVEVEAYLGLEDLAAHASRGVTGRTRVLFGPPGRAYVYFIYGMYHCLNAVTESEGYPAAVLLRAVEPIAGVRESATGPGRLCRAMQIDLRLNREDLGGETLFVLGRARGDSPRVAAARRVGIDSIGGVWARKPWRFFDADSDAVSARPRRPRVLGPR